MTFGVFMHKDGSIYDDIRKCGTSFLKAISVAPSKW